jgi:ATP-binding cassette subfamily B protein
MRPAVFKENLALWRELLGLCRRRNKAMFAGVIAALLGDTLAIVLIGLGLREIVSGTLHNSAGVIVTGALGAALAYSMTIWLDELGRTLRVDLVELVTFETVVPGVRASAMNIETIDHLERSAYLDRLHVVQEGGWNIVDSAWSALESVGLALRLALILALLGSVSPAMFLILAVGAVPVWCDHHGKIELKAAEVERGEQRRLQRELFELATGAAAGKEIRVAGVGPELVRLQREAADAADAIWLRARLRAGLWSALGWSLFSLVFVAGLALVVHSAATRPSRVGDIVLLVTVGSQLRMIVEQTVRRSADAGGYGRVLKPFHWLRAYDARERERAATERAAAGTAAGSTAPSRLTHGITIEDLGFSYPGTDRRAVDGVSVHLPAGAVVAVVGEYGSGKTTLVKLLTKMYRPDTGRILLDGKDLAAIEPASWRGGMSAAFQDFGRYHATVAEAVGFGDVSSLESDADAERIAEAVRDADAEDFVLRLPDGLASALGREFGGADLSEGQWQKLALARASMRAAPLLFVLDEPTASLDAPSEHAIFQRHMARAREIGDRTGGITLIVSHRFSTVAGADLILVMEAGHLKEAGTHKELIADPDSRYAELFGLQAGAYTG